MLSVLVAFQIFSIGSALLVNILIKVID